MHTRTLTWQLEDGTRLELPYYPTQMELLLEDFAQKHDIELSDAEEESAYFCANYSRSLSRPINGITLTYDRHIWEDEEEYLDQIRDSIPSGGFGGLIDILNEGNVITHMRCLHDPSLYTEELSIQGPDINFKFGFKQGRLNNWEGDSHFLTPQEFQLLGRYFTEGSEITQTVFSRKIEETEPMKLLGIVLDSVEKYR